MSGDAACEDIFALEVWEVVSLGPTSCFDLVHGPDTPIACRKLDYAGMDGRPRQSQVTARFPGPDARVHGSAIDEA